VRRKDDIVTRSYNIREPGYDISGPGPGETPGNICPIDLSITLSVKTVGRMVEGSI